MFENMILAFMPIFFAVDAVGTLPIFILCTQGLSNKEKRAIISQSVITAVCLSIGFVFVGRAILSVLGVSVGDFMVAGGTILFCIAIIDIMSSEKKRRMPGAAFGVVPLGTPLIAGPAVLTMSLIVITEYGLAATAISITANILLAGFVFRVSDLVIKVLGEVGTKAISKVTSLLLASIAVMMIRKGILGLMTSL